MCLIFMVLAIAVYAVVSFVNLDWCPEALKNSFVFPKSEADKASVSSAHSVGEIYTYKDKNGVTVISDKSIPEEYKNEANKIGTYNRDSAEGKDSLRVRTTRKQTGEVDVTCKYECGVFLNTCELDCKQMEACKDNCWQTHKNCMNRCDN